MNQVSPEQRCSALSRSAHEPQAGTAPQVATGFVMIEDDGAWGRKGLLDCSIPTSTAKAIEQAANAVGLKAMLFRPVRRIDHETAGRRVFVSRHRGEPALVRASIRTAEELLDADFTSVDGDLSRVLPGAEPVTEPVLFVCTHAKRDQCCAISGLPLARSLAASHPDRVFECSHLGGHRFAPTALVLPSGSVYGRLSDADGVEVLLAEQRGEILAARLRGRSILSKIEQAADAALRTQTGLVGVDDVRVIETLDGDPSVVRLAAAGSTWRVEVRQHESAARAISCGADPDTTTEMIIGSISRDD